MKKLAILAWVFLVASTVTLGGGLAMLPLLEREFVERRKWLSETEMTDLIAVMQSLPGLVAVNMAVLVGYRVKGISGACVAAFAACLTPFLAIVVIVSAASSWLKSPTLEHMFLGIRAGVAALIALSLVKLAKQVLTGALGWVLGAMGFVLAVVFRVDVTWVVLMGFAVGMVMVAIEAVRRAGK